LDFIGQWRWQRVQALRAQQCEEVFIAEEIPESRHNKQQTVFRHLRLLYQKFLPVGFLPVNSN